jgi:hypothetical protein
LAARRRLVWPALLAASAAAAAGCGADQPVLTLAFKDLPAGTQRIEVTLHGEGATFMGPDAGNDQVGVSYVGGNVVIKIEAAYAAARGNRIRLPLTAANDITLDGTARADAGPDTQSTVAMSTAVMAHQSATLTFDFASSDGGTDASSDAGIDAGSDGVVDADAKGDTSMDIAGDVPGDVASNDVPASEVGGDVARDVPAEMPAGDVPADMSPTDAPPDIPTPPDTGVDATLAPNCAVRGQFAASSMTGGSGPTVAYSAPLFGVVWKAANDFFYNAVSSGGTLQLASDKTVVSGTGQGLNTPRLARIGNDFALAYGRHDSMGAQAAIVRVAPATGIATGPATLGMNRPGLAASPDVGGVAVSGDQKWLAVISRAADLSAQTAAIVDEFSNAFMFVNSWMPAALGTTRTTGIGWAPGRFLAGAVTQATSAGGTLLEVADDMNLMSGPYPFTSGSAAPVVGSSGATMSVAGAGDRVAVAWVDLQGGRRVVTAALVPLKTQAVGAPVPASTSAVTKYYPHLVFDGVAFALAWLEASSSSDSQIVLRRFDTNLTPVGAPLNVGPAGAVGLGDFDIAAAGPNAYGIAAAGPTSTQQLFYVICN